MRFGPVSLEESEGQILAQNVSDESGRRVLRKGRPLDPPALQLLRELGYETVFIARLDEGDTHENEAAERIARMVAGRGVEGAAAHAGRVNVTAKELGVVQVDVESLLRLNDTGVVTVATLPTHAVVRPGERAATVKVIPYAIPREAVSRAEALFVGEGIVSVRTIDRQAVAIVLVGGTGAWPVLEEGIGDAIRERIEALGCFISEMTFTHTDEGSVSDALQRQVARGVGMIVVAGETAIMDLDDLIPRGLRLAGVESNSWASHGSWATSPPRVSPRDPGGGCSGVRPRHFSGRIRLGGPPAPGRRATGRDRPPRAGARWPLVSSATQMRR